MVRGHQFIRQWKILHMLISSKVGKSASELASELNCNLRTVYRDLNVLHDAGFPIYSYWVDGKSLWTMHNLQKQKISIPLSQTELIALYLGTDLFKIFKGTLFHDSFESLSQKIKAMLPPDSLKFLKNLEHIFYIGFKPSMDYGKFREIIQKLNKSLDNRNTIEMLYYSMWRKKETWRKVDPYCIWFFNGTFYMIGYCHMRKEVRIFALDRIKKLQETMDSFQIPKGFNLHEFMGKSLGVFKGKPVKVKIWFSSEVAEYIKDKTWIKGQKIQEKDDGSIIFEAEVEGTDEVRFWVMSWGTNAVLLEPKLLRDEIMRELKNMLHRYKREMKIKIE